MDVTPNSLQNGLLILLTTVTIALSYLTYRKTAVPVVTVNVISNATLYPGKQDVQFICTVINSGIVPFSIQSLEIRAVHPRLHLLGVGYAQYLCDLLFTPVGRWDYRGILLSKGSKPLMAGEQWFHVQPLGLIDSNKFYCYVLVIHTSQGEVKSKPQRIGKQ